MIKWLTIHCISITDCHSTKGFFFKGDASGKQIEPICIAIETLKVIKLLFFTTESVKSHEAALKYSEAHESESSSKQTEKFSLQKFGLLLSYYHKIREEWLQT